MGSQLGRVKRHDESFENFCHAFSSGLTDRPWVSEDAESLNVLFKDTQTNRTRSRIKIVGL